MTPELQAWLDSLKETGEITDEEFTTLSAVAAKPKAGEAMQKSVMLNRDYTQKTQTLATERKALEDATSNLSKWRDEEIVPLVAEKEEQLAAALRQIEQSNLRGAALESRLRTIGKTYNLDEEELMRDILEARADAREQPNPVIPTGSPKQPDETRADFITRKEYEQALNLAARLPIQTMQIAQEYAQLYGKPYDGDLDEFVQRAWTEAPKRGMKFMDYARQELKFDEQRRTNERKTWDEEKAREIEEATTRTRSEVLLERSNNKVPDNASVFLRAKVGEKGQARPGSQAHKEEGRLSARQDFLDRQAARGAA